MCPCSHPLKKSWLRAWVYPCMAHTTHFFQLNNIHEQYYPNNRIAGKCEKLIKEIVFKSLECCVTTDVGIPSVPVTECQNIICYVLRRTVRLWNETRLVTEGKVPLVMRDDRLYFLEITSLEIRKSYPNFARSCNYIHNKMLKIILNSSQWLVPPDLHIGVLMYELFQSMEPSIWLSGLD
jgi:hypothetical protein